MGKRKIHDEISSGFAYMFMTGVFVGTGITSVIVSLDVTPVEGQQSRPGCAWSVVSLSAGSHLRS